MGIPLETPRLVIREINLDDAPFILELLNEPAFIHFIGDRGVRSIEDAQGYISKGPQASYTKLGFGLWLAAQKDTQTPIGICGLLKRDSLPDVDLGYAFLARFRSQGYASEAASAVKDYAVERLGIKRLAGITNPDNWASIKVLEKIGMRFERLVQLSENEPELKLFVGDFP
jgi:RimJ/RimL family protein N-acetyltransferase